MHRLLIILFAVLSSVAFGQTNFPCSFKVLDATTDQPVKGALITIDQGGLPTLQSDMEGFCRFSSLPEGRIDVNVSHIDYRSARTQFTISREVKNNAYVIKLVPNSEGNLLVTGKVENPQGLNMSGVNVEVKVDGKPFFTTTDAGGNYQFNIKVQTIRSDKLQLEYRKGDCKYSEEVPVPEKRYLSKNVRLNCGGPGDGEPPPPGGDEINMAGVWDLIIYTEYIAREEGTQRAGYQIGNMLNLKQQGNKITGKFSSSSSVQCRTGEVSGEINPSDNSIKLTVICTQGYCSGNAGYIIMGKFINGTFVGEVKPSQDPTKKCILYIGKIKLTRA